jgi:bzd-type benzoyl-CoA reductase N subunit
MNSAQELMQASDIKANPYINKWKEEGKKILGTICCHVPEEILHAAGIMPYRLRATGSTDISDAEAWMSTFSCTFAKGCLEYLINGQFDFLSGIVSSDGCLLAGRVFDNWRYIDNNKDKAELYFQMVGAPRIYNEKGVDYYKGELKELISGLEKYTGHKITEEKLKESVDLYNETRELIRELYALSKTENPVITGYERLKIILAATSMPKQDFNKLLKDFLAEVKTRKPVENVRVRLMMVGSALDDPEYVKAIEDKGGLIVSDAICFGSRYLWEPVELGSDVIGSMAQSYLSRPVCPRMCNLNYTFKDLLVNMAKEYHVDGIIFEVMKYCEVWSAQGLYLEEALKEAGVPLLKLEREEIMTNIGQLAVRAEAFIEMLEK